MATAARTGHPRTFWMAIAIAVLAVLVTILNWPSPPPNQGPPPPLTTEGAKGLDDNLLVAYTSRDVLWQMMGKDKALDAWRQAPEPAKHIYVLATGGRALNTCGLLDWCIQRQTRGELPTLDEIAASYTAVGLPKIATLVSAANGIAEKQAGAIRNCTSWDPSGGGPRPADPFARVQGDLTRALLMTDEVKQQAAYIKAHAKVLLAPANP